MAGGTDGKLELMTDGAPLAGILHSAVPEPLETTTNASPSASTATGDWEEPGALVSSVFCTPANVTWAGAMRGSINAASRGNQTPATRPLRPTSTRDSGWAAESMVGAELEIRKWRGLGASQAGSGTSI